MLVSRPSLHHQPFSHFQNVMFKCFLGSLGFEPKSTCLTVPGLSMLWMAVLGAILLWSATPIESQPSTQRRQGRCSPHSSSTDSIIVTGNFSFFYLSSSLSDKPEAMLGGWCRRNLHVRIRMHQIRRLSHRHVRRQFHVWLVLCPQQHF